MMMTYLKRFLSETSFFCECSSKLKIIRSENFVTTIQHETENLVQNEMNKFKNHPSISDNV